MTPTPPPASTAGGRRRAPSFSELVAGLVEDGVLSAERAKAVLEREDAQRASVVRARLLEQRALPPSQQGTPPTITTVELFMAFGEKGEDEQPIREDVVTEAWARRAAVPYVKLDPLKLDPDLAVRTVSKPYARKHGYLAIKEEGGTLTIATHDPFDALAHETVERITSKRVELVVASKTDIERLITEFYGFRQSVQRAEKQIAIGIDLGNLEQLVKMKSEQEIEASDEHVVHAVDYLFRYALGQRASDIHLEPKRQRGIIRFRIDGALHQVGELPGLVHKAVINRIKTLSRLDISEKRKPQDGRIKVEHDGKPVEVRVSTLPVAFGEKIVMRLFDPDLVQDDLERLGFFERDRKIFEELIALPHGIILVTGPTGSGKSTTLYTALRKLASDDINITTIEDPIENVFEGINQTAIMPAIGLGFAEVLRTILRQDPDVIMVGEIRDLDTARHAIQAALTGHLVLSTLHTNDAASAVTRMLDLGVQDFLLSSTLVGVMAQRLVRRVCSACASERVLSEEEAGNLGVDASAGAILVRYGKGCADCRMTGYKGRIAVVELFKVTPTLRKMVHDRADEALIKAEAQREGMLTLRESAIKKMLMGETTYEEVIAVTTV
jgi:general secretion pathway protein E